MVSNFRPLVHFSSFLLFISSCFAPTFSSSNSGEELPTKFGNGYRLISVDKSTDGGLICQLQVKQRNNIYGPDIPFLQLYVKHETGDRLRVHITDANHQRWEVPYNLLPRAQPQSQTTGQFQNPNTPTEFTGTELIFSYITDPFSFSVKRKSNGEILFNSISNNNSPYNSLVFKDQYLELSTALTENASVYGLGENTQPHGIRTRDGRRINPRLI